MKLSLRLIAAIAVLLTLCGCNKENMRQRITEKLRVESLEKVDQERFSQVVSLAFQQRRKTLRNALSTLMTEADIEAAGVNPAARAETLDVAAYVRLAQRASELPAHPDAV